MIEKTGLVQVNTLARSVCYLRQSVVACALDGDVCVCVCVCVCVLVIYSFNGRRPSGIRHW
jgi:hypothetical protein